MNISEFATGSGIFNDLQSRINSDFVFIASIFLATSKVELDGDLIQVMDAHLLHSPDEINEMINGVKALLSAKGDSGDSSVENSGNSVVVL